MEYAGHLFFLICIYAMLASSLDLVVGYAGLLSLGHAAPFGMGAYATALLLLRTDLPFWTVTVLGILVAAGVHFLIAIPSLKLKGDFFTLATLGFAETLRIFTQNLTPLTRGPMGLPGIPQPLAILPAVSPTLQFDAVACPVTVCVVVGLRIAVRSRFGKMLQAARDDAEWLSSLGKNPERIQRAAVFIAGSVAGLAGALYAQYTTFIEPSVFGLTESILVLCMVILGGPGTVWGSIFGAGFLILLPESLRWIGLPAPLLGALRQMLYGILLVVFMLFRPRGVWGNPWAWRSMR